MEPEKNLENYPIPMVLAAVLVNLAIYTLGATILSGFGILPAGLYLLYCLGNEFHVMKMSCVDCYYYGKWCAFAKGKIAPLIFQRGEPGRFIVKCISWRELLPDLFVLLLPLTGGITLLSRDFSARVTMALVVLVALSLGGNYLVRSRIACVHCRQRLLGCPAEQYFNRQ